MTKQELFDKADKYKETISKSRPLSEREIKEIENYFKIGVTYSSNALEGNSLTITETKILIEDGITVGGKPVKDYYEASGHSNAYDYMIKIAKEKPIVINEEIILKLHNLFYNKVDSENAGKYRIEQVFISGTEYLPPAAEEVPQLMKEFIENINLKKDILHPIEFAALLHKGLVDIHPFVDGNGRTARLLMNLVLVAYGYGVALIPPVLRREYIDSLIISQREKNSDVEPFIKLIAECVIETEKDYCMILKIT